MSEGIRLNLETNPTEYNRRLIVHADHLYAIGGENGTITATSLSDPSSFRVVQQYDEPVRALAFSPDGKRVAVGYEDGNVDIYSFDSEQLEQGVHPFLGNHGNNDTTSKSQDVFDDFLSQDNDGLFDSSEKLTPSFRLGHRFEASIRSLEFDPRCKNGKYFLAISSEAAPGFMVVDATNEKSFQKFFATESEKEYNQGGVRSLQYSPDGSMITSLGLDGKLCFWSVEGSDPELEWELVHSDSHKVITKPDLGQFADSADRSCYPTWNVDGSILALPGDKDLQLRRKTNSDSNWMKNDCIVLSPSNDESNCEIVAISFDPRNEGYVVTSSRDGKVGLWKLTDESSRVRKQYDCVQLLHTTPNTL
jgi:WD40 repeat protein